MRVKYLSKLILVLMFLGSQCSFAGGSEKEAMGLWDQIIQMLFPKPCPPPQKLGFQLDRTVYKNCLETMPGFLNGHTSPECQANHVQPGNTCIAFEDRAYNAKAFASPEKADRLYHDGMALNDNGNSQACLRYTNGYFKRPHPEFLQRTKDLAKFIKSTAKYYHVPPEAIACAIGGDATTTVGTYPNQASYYNPMIQKYPVEDALVDFKNWKLNLLKPPQPDASSTITDKEYGSIVAAALVLRHDKEVYLRAGFTNADLPPEVLVSIYHLGAYRGKDRTNSALTKKAQGKKPGLSFLGVFCSKNKEAILNALESK